MLVFKNLTKNMNTVKKKMEESETMELPDVSEMEI